MLFPFFFGALIGAHPPFFEALGFDELLVKGLFFYVIHEVHGVYPEVGLNVVQHFYAFFKLFKLNIEVEQQVLTIQNVG